LLLVVYEISIEAYLESAIDLYPQLIWEKVQVDVVNLFLLFAQNVVIMIELA
jgi:hypothetical protein